eukprot:PhM_4_TR2627/c0_g2_i1/m.76154
MYNHIIDVESFRQHHFAVISIPPHDAVARDICAMREAMSNFFREQPTPIKHTAAMPSPSHLPPSSSVGYSVDSLSLVEKYTVRMPALGGAFPWPLAPADFEVDVRRGFGALERLGRQVLQAVMTVCEIGDGCVDSIVGGHHGPADGYVSNHILFGRHMLARLQPTEAAPRGIDAHTDSGVVTLIPFYDVRGLQVYSGGDWLDVSVDPQSADGGYVKIFVMAGEELAALTNGHIAASIHRVRWGGPLQDGEVEGGVEEELSSRLTTPFQLRMSSQYKSSQLDGPRQASSGFTAKMLCFS